MILLLMIDRSCSDLKAFTIFISLDFQGRCLEKNRKANVDKVKTTRLTI